MAFIGPQVDAGRQAGSSPSSVPAGNTGRPGLVRVIMRFLLCVAAAAVAGATAASGSRGQAQDGRRGNDGVMVSRAPYRLPAYSDASGMRPYASQDEYDRARTDARFALERVVYMSDGLPVVAYVYAPARPGPHPAPVVLFNRGGYVQPEIAHQLIAMFHRLAERGFAVVAPLLRGSAGAPGADEMGGADVRDILHAGTLVAGLAGLDAGNQFLYGESRGGAMTFLALKAGYPARAAATFGAFTDLEQLMASNAALYDPLIPRIWPDFASRRGEILTARSAGRWPDALTVPLLLMHGGADRSVDPGQTLALAAGLQRIGRPYELAVFAGDDHVLSAHRIERDAHAAAWFTAHLRR